MLVVRADDGEGVVVELLELGQVLRVEAVEHRDLLQPVGGRELGQLLRRGTDHVEPLEPGIAFLEYCASGHERQMRLAAAAAPKPLSIFTTVIPAAQELSMPSSAARPPKAAP